MKKITEFNGIPSGDNEAFCWDVDKETFIKINGEKPSKYDKSFFNKNTYRLYPNDTFRKNKDNCNDKFTKPIKIKIEWEE